MVDVELVGFDTVLAATVAGWPVSAGEAVRWCGQRQVSPKLVAGWSTAAGVWAYTLMADGTPVGYGELWLDDDEVELARLIVAPAHRRQGVGRRLVEGLVEAAAAREGLIFLRAHPDNTAAISVYRAVGFEPVDAATAAEWNVDQPVAYDWLTYVAVVPNGT
ncbi:MAG TPA: GNAT family N-acetyltransferase [Pseudonocardiaceae bacterium]|jgi:ribosomal protein S18 acetylase RimI-like enzyme|nr:GNAT family N-acetyltransferase [Pseudonocardiaceae bacterium]